MTAGRPKIYKDDILKSKCFRISEKYELNFIVLFIQILRKYRKQAVKFISRFEGLL